VGLATNLINLILLALEIARIFDVNFSAFFLTKSRLVAQSVALQVNVMEARTPQQVSQGEFLIACWCADAINCPTGSCSFTRVVGAVLFSGNISLFTRKQ